MILILFLQQATISLIPPFFREKSEPLFLEELIVTQTTLPYKKREGPTMDRYYGWMD